MIHLAPTTIRNLRMHQSICKKPINNVNLLPRKELLPLCLLHTISNLQSLKKSINQKEITGLGPIPNIGFKDKRSQYAMASSCRTNWDQSSVLTTLLKSLVRSKKPFKLKLKSIKLRLSQLKYKKHIQVTLTRCL